MRFLQCARDSVLPSDRLTAICTSRTRRILCGSLLGVAVLAAAGCSSSSSSSSSGSGSANLESLNFGVAVATPTSATQYVALDEGFFAKHGLNVHIVSFSGGSASLSATAAGNPPVAREDSFATLEAIHKGYPIQVVEENNSALPGDFVISSSVANKRGVVATTDVKKFLQDIKGLTIGNQAPGDTFQLILSGLLKENGLPGNWITRNDLRKAPQVLEALQHGAIAGAFTDAPAPQEAQSSGYGKVIFSTSDISSAFNTVVDGVVVANTSWAKSHQKELSELAAAFTEANKFILANPTAAAQVLHKDQFSSISVPLLVDTLKSQHETTSVAVNKSNWDEVGTLSNQYGLESFHVTPGLLTKALTG